MCFHKLSNDPLLTWIPNAIQYEHKRNDCCCCCYCFFFALAQKKWIDEHRCYKIPFYYSFCWFFVYKFRLSFRNTSKIRTMLNRHHNHRSPLVRQFACTLNTKLPAIHLTSGKINDKRKADTQKKQQQRQRCNSLFKAHLTLSLWTFSFRAHLTMHKKRYYYHHHNQKVIPRVNNKNCNTCTIIKSQLRKVYSRKWWNSRKFSIEINRLNCMLSVFKAKNQAHEE